MVKLFLLQLEVKIRQILRLTAKIFGRLRLTVNPTETLDHIFRYVIIPKPYFALNQKKRATQA